MTLVKISLNSSRVLGSSPGWAIEPGFPVGTGGKEPASVGDVRDVGSFPGLGRTPGVGNRKCQPTPVFLPGKFYGQRSPVGLQSIRLQKSWTRLSDRMHTHTGE